MIKVHYGFKETTKNWHWKVLDFHEYIVSSQPQNTIVKDILWFYTWCPGKLSDSLKVKY